MLRWVLSKSWSEIIRKVYWFNPMPVPGSATAILKAHDEGKSVKELYKTFGVDKGLFCDLVYIVLWKADRLPKSKYAERVAAKHPVMLDKRFIHPRPEKEED